MTDIVATQFATRRRNTCLCLVSGTDETSEEAAAQLHEDLSGLALPPT